MKKRSRKILCLGILLCMGLQAAWAASFDPSHKLYAKVLKEYVQNGLVNYSSLKSNRAPLDLYLEQMGSVTQSDFEAWSKEEQIAYLLNLYNAETLQLIIDHYPVKSIKEIGGLIKASWDLPVVRLFGEETTLNVIEHKMLRKNYLEPRVHFALVCAARGCPPLREEPYEPQKLEQQLEDQGRRFLNTPEKNRADMNQKILHLSPIFHWFKGDFEAKADSVKNFIQPYFSAEAVKDLSLNRYGIQYTVYDWSLNDWKPEDIPTKNVR